MKFSGKTIMAIAVCTVFSAITFAASQGKLKFDIPTKKEAPAPKKDNTAAKKKAAEDAAKKKAAAEAAAKKRQQEEAAKKKAAAEATAKKRQQEIARKKAAEDAVHHPGKDEFGREYVNLGLPGGVLWATCNVGASKPEEYGLYFAWGETKGHTRNDKAGFDMDTYKWYDSSSAGLTKYCTKSSEGKVDNRKVLDATDDAAIANWGADWRMPSRQEIEDLFGGGFTMTEWVSVNGVNGRKITSKSNGNSIFLPAAGWCDDTSPSNDGSYGSYWSHELFSSGSYAAYGLDFTSGSIGWNYNIRYSGRSVRAVRVP